MLVLAMEGSQMEYKDFKIEIEIEDNKKHTDVALLVDRKDFFEDTIKAREAAGLSQLLPYGSPPLQHLNPKKHYIDLQGCTTEMMRKYNVPYFGLTINAAILYGKVTETDYGPLVAPLIIIPPQKDGNSYERYIEKGIESFWTVGEGNQPELGILFSPYAKVEDILNSVNKTQIERLKKQHRKLIKEIVPNSDTKPAIREHREWYWENVRGKSPYKIAKDLKERGNVSDLKVISDNISKEIQIYKKLLKRPSI